jgi:drug/metabolite transporter superfamily protein YnfA
MIEFLKDIWSYLRQQKKWWLIPIILALLVLGLLMIFAETTAVGAFVYPLF